MITWMQRHRKYLVITIWISTIAFIGAGFVGWGQYKYGEKSGAIAKVGDVSITQREWQQAYSRLFDRYSRMFQGQFDREQAKKFGLDKQALRQLINEALLLNLANSYNLEATDAEVAAALARQQAFFENGTFSKELYLRVLKQNRMTTVEYESDLRKSILIRKVLSLFEPVAEPVEKEAFKTAMGIADRIEYKILTDDMVDIDTSDAALKAYWEAHKNDYLTPRAFKIEYFEQTPVSAEADEAALRAYYKAHKHDFVGPDGKLLSFENAKDLVKKALDDKATNKAALKSYIAYKKGRLDSGVALRQVTVTETDNNGFSPETFGAIAGAAPTQPYLKPKKEGDRYVIIKVLESIAPKPMSFADARDAVLADYKRKASSEKLIELAKSEVKTFTGKTTEGFLTRQSTEGIEGLDPEETAELLAAVFKSERARGIAGLKTHKMVLYRIVDQKIEEGQDEGVTQAVVQTKIALLNSGLIKKLDSRYKTRIFVEGFGQ